MPSVSALIKPVSGACPYSCSYCFYRDELSKRGIEPLSQMSQETLEATVKKVLAYSNGNAAFVFQGGEPTLAGLEFFRYFAYLLSKYRKQMRPFLSLQTNGALIDDEWAAFLKDNGFLVGLSIDGAREEHDALRKDTAGCGTFERTEEAAKILQKHGVEFNVLSVVSRVNAAKPEETYNALKKYGYLQFIPCIDPFDVKEDSWAPSAGELGKFFAECFDMYKNDLTSGNYVSIRQFDNWIKMLNEGTPDSCSMCGKCTPSLTVEADGSVYPCDFYALDEWKMGNINTDSVTNMLNGSAARKFRQTSVYVSGECRACKYYSICRGGCRRDREPFDEFGRPGLNRLCAAYRYFFDLRYNELLNTAKSVKR